jgi:hypothetical protein
LSEAKGEHTEKTNRLSNQFNSYYMSDSEGSTCESAQVMSQIIKRMDVKKIQSQLNLVLKTIFETITFHCKLTNELINEIENEMEFLQEYNKRWNAYVASMIKIDEMLSPLSRVVNKVYKRLYPEYPCFPQFSFLRLFVITWKREVYKS